MQQFPTSREKMREKLTSICNKKTPHGTTFSNKNSNKHPILIVALYSCLSHKNDAHMWHFKTPFATS
jgi:hypothetical protein